MKFQAGDAVKILVERGVAKEGDVGVVTAVHPDHYVVGFYATEGALIDSQNFYPEELAPAENVDTSAPFEKEDEVEVLKERYGYPAGLVGEIMDVYPEKKAAAVKLKKPEDDFPAILPYPWDELKKR